MHDAKGVSTDPRSMFEVPGSITHDDNRLISKNDAITGKVQSIFIGAKNHFGAWNRFAIHAHDCSSDCLTFRERELHFPGLGELERFGARREMARSSYFEEVVTGSIGGL